MDRRAIPPDAVEGLWHAADGWPIRRIDWPLPAGGAKGSILFLPGRGDFYEKYLETLDHWARAGWRVTASDWRGQAGSGRLGTDAVTGHIDDFEIWVRDLAYFWQHWTSETPGPHVIAGHSMGGHLVLRALAERAIAPAAAVLSAPMLGFINHGVPATVMHLAARLMSSLGDKRRPAWKWSEKPGEIPAGRMDLLTHDTERYDDELWWRRQRPELVMGPGSWGWVERGYESVGLIDREVALAKVQTPVFIAATDADRLVSFAAIERAARWLPRGEIFVLGNEASHEVLREIDAVRDLVIEGIDGFLAGVAAKKDA
ncbi:MAG: alpha/beta hydrolase [Candidatus Andeanibacterium colombiense]|uniref:Alpha/beta hydrolase n=1 Tax=Candidatus Andeanibacterium colombiense TaxID=3121345 RepID=A0AAJ5XB78_9SPHN|nr:MAG: alpha/beta hydrolase [Sphingomonadaceae bacterium]